MRHGENRYVIVVVVVVVVVVDTSSIKRLRKSFRTSTDEGDECMPSSKTQGLRENVANTVQLDGLSSSNGERNVPGRTFEAHWMRSSRLVNSSRCSSNASVQNFRSSFVYKLNTIRVAI